MNEPAALSVDETVRRRFETDWRKGNPSAIESYLPSDQSIQYLPTLEELVCIEMEFLWSRETENATIIPNADTLDDFTSQPTHVEDYISRYPKLGEPSIVRRLVEHEIEVRRDSKVPCSLAEIQKRFPKLDIPTSLFDSQGKPRSGRRSTLAPLTPEDLPRWFGRYQLREVLGQGGMATVYRAHQHAIDRELAVKIGHLPPYGDVTEFKSRFIAEATAAAKLNHDNIVSVFDVGEIDGQPYYTMPILSGGDLESQLKDGPLSSREAASRLLDAAKGVAAAHASGVLHRDLKPRNLMIDVQRDRTMVADFGLAGEIVTGDVGSGVDRDAIARFTRTGQILGTPPYMAPEQIRDARDAEVRSDVYSLGATLYHALTGRPPFQASTPTETLRQVLESDPVAPRQLNNAVDLDLDTIVMKCLDKEPKRRYESATAFADDLDRYLEGKPIAARRITPIGRAIRWSKRNKRVAALSGLSAIAILAAIVSTVIGLAVSNYKSNQIFNQLKISRASLDENYSGLLSSSAFENQPGKEAVRKEMLERSLKYYNEFARFADAVDMRTDLGIAQVRLGELNLELVGPAAATADFTRAVATFERLNAGARKSIAVRRAMSDAHNGIGQALMAIGDYQQGLVEFRLAGEVRKDLYDQYSESVEFGRKYANSLMNQGLAQARLNEFKSASKLQLQAQELRAALLERDANDTNVLRDSGKGEFGLALLALDQEDLESAETHLDGATSKMVALLRRTPSDGAAWMRLVRCQLLRSAVAMELGNVPVASELLKQAMKNLEPLAVMAKYSWDYRLELIPVYQQSVRMLLDRGEIGEAAQRSDQVESMLAYDSGEDVDEESIRLIRIRLIQQSLKGLIARDTGDQKTGNQLIRETLDRWNQVRERFADDEELASEMDHLALLITDLDV